ncbi:MAG: FKBP-type peptidyl-prolyl cis-trans isomerase [Gemmatimonadetes bacterium]|nr:FKBP-type peptidyl-prolyl cis-trans isomerase [Gemmatimonadota bacterium]NIQ53124.1 FKBP-type peptidyl-prolyl cis-trans isomerase [Gemmatimonadota bacterium]NIU73274.1 FKBP-type peptidyl-prolyl cis-trans isomerase [Gammaproteobacteria bacterium]NIX43533.1 FKBP-type peptidyl-prolyl cis-trans isomerase [Gemmatimonadota bacterium]NIY07715.1 FKBP-type peptidyl-prolyl cis-trans isomerase [Gemmatimonadota bacterium]
MPPGRQVADRYAPALDIDLSEMERLWSGLYIDDVRVGEGARADSGDVVTVHYTGWLPNGMEFDSSRDGRPFEVPLGYGRVIDGWDQGIVGMREGGRRRLVIPPAMGYGERGQGPIPANSTLVFDVELLGVQDRTP